MTKKSVFVAVIGETNAGKSTLINHLIGQKVSIVSHKVQTTRFKILGILTELNNQIVFIDTPGIFNPKRNFDKAMIKLSYLQIEEADIILFLLDCNKGITHETENILNKLKGATDKKIILVLNKIDIIKKEELLTLATYFNAQLMFQEIFMVSALKGDGLKDVVKYLENNMCHDLWYFEEDQVSDQQLSQIACEITREKIYKFLNQELPYQIIVEHIQWTENERKIEIHQNIYVAKDNYKGMVLGKGGSKIKDIRMAAMSEMKKEFGKNVSLFLFIKVDEKIFDRQSTFQMMGLDL